MAPANTSAGKSYFPYDFRTFRFEKEVLINTEEKKKRL